MADGMSLVGSLWQCTRAIDQTQFLMTFYPGGGMGGGELENGEVSPYIFGNVGALPRLAVRDSGIHRPRQTTGAP